MSYLRLCTFLLALLPAPALAASQPFSITRFTNVRVDAPIRVEIVTGRGVSARGEGDRETLDRLNLSVNGDMLTIRLGASTLSSGRTGSGVVTLRLTTDAIDRIILTGAGDIQLDRMKGLNGIVSVRGPGNVSVGSVAVDRLTLGLAGDGNISLAGRALTGTVDVRGSGTIKAEALVIDTLRLKTAGAGTATVAGGKAADVVAVGAGAVTVLGKPACTVTHAGTGQVSCGGKDY